MGDNTNITKCSRGILVRFSAVVVAGLIYLIVGSIEISNSLGGLSISQKINYIYSLGFGVPASLALYNIRGPTWAYSASKSIFYSNVLFANVWQFGISFVYLLINALVTAMSVGSEWAHYGKHRKPLRVSSPQGIQRSSFFVSMPYKYGVPLMVSVSVLHWAVSQAVFVVQITSYYSTGQLDKYGSTSAIGYSTSAITTSIVLGLAIMLGVVALGFKKYDSGMPLASTCSAAISAACHPPEEDYDAPYLPVLWGVVERNDQGFVHCSFTTAIDARPLGERDGWREWQDNYSDCEIKDKAIIIQEEEQTTKRVDQTSTGNDGYRQDTTNGSQGTFSSAKGWYSGIFAKFRRRSKKACVDHTNESTDNEEKLTDIIAPRSTKE